MAAGCLAAGGIGLRFAPRPRPDGPAPGSGAQRQENRLHLSIQPAPDRRHDTARQCGTVRSFKETVVAKVSTYLNFPGNTEAAFIFYSSVFETKFDAPGIRRM